MGHRTDFQTLVDLMIGLIEANANQRIGVGKEHLMQAQILTVKMLRHLVSMNSVSNGVHIAQENVLRAEYYDFSSVHVLLRAAIETHLAFNFIYSPDDESLVRFRHLAWRYGGLKQRLKLTAELEASVEKQRLTQRDHDDLQAELLASQHYQALEKFGRKKISEGNWDGGRGWVKIATETGFHSTYFHNVYTYCCSHAHSDFVSAIQIECARSEEDQQMLATGGFCTACMVLAHHVRLFIKLFPYTLPAYLGNEAAASLVEKWYIRAEDMTESLASSRKAAE